MNEYSLTNIKWEPIEINELSTIIFVYQQTLFSW